VQTASGADAVQPDACNRKLPTRNATATDIRAVPGQGARAAGGYLTFAAGARCLVVPFVVRMSRYRSAAIRM